MSELVNTKGVTKFACDQCAYGCRHPETQQPIRKPTGFLCSGLLRAAARKCRCRRPHGELQGKLKNGLSATAMAEAYPWPLCRALVKDIETMIRPGSIKDALWTCPKCKHGVRTTQPRPRLLPISQGTGS